MGFSLRRACAAASTIAVVAGLGGLVVSSPAEADTAPAAGTPATVSADALPTWQVNGVVWGQEVVGTNVFAGGSFSTARPPGVAAGGTGQVTANNFFVYDITTGNRVASMAHSVNGQILTVNKSPDGSRVYIGGDFTTVDGVTRNHIAAFNATTGALVTTFSPSVSGQVRAIAVSDTTVYAGGTFSKVGSSVRGRLAAFNPATGALLPWAPTADDFKVSALVMSPDSSKVVVGGSFSTLNGVPASGMGALDATTGATLPWLANQTIRDGGDNTGGITSLSVDANQVYGSGFAFGSGQFEGSFAADPSSGAIRWANDCHGDTYDTLPIGQALYTVSHAHNCSAIGEFPQTDPWSVNMRHALAYTTYPTGTNTGPDDYGWDYSGVPSSSLLQWYPDLKTGSVTGQGQAAWTVAGNNDYVALGGEFPSVNGTAQQGLVRFATKRLAPNKRAPVKAPNAPAPTAASLNSGTARVAWQSAYDMDNESLTYDVYRSGTTAPVFTKTQDSNFWTYPMMGFVDRGLTPGATYTYTIKVTDPSGNVLTLPKTDPVTVSSATPSAYTKDVLGDGAASFWRLGEPSGTTAFDYAGFDDATVSAGVTRGADGAIGSDPDQASGFSGAADGLVATRSAKTATPSFTVESWVKTTSTSGGKIIGYGNAATGDSTGYDRHVYLDNDGHVIFGVYPGGVHTIQSSGAINDGNYHHVVASLSATTGMALYIDGKKVAADPGVTSGQDYAGYWRIGGDNLNGWPNQPSSSYLAGTIDDVAVYPAALSLVQVQQHYVDSGRSLSVAPKPTDAYGKAVYESGPDLYWRLGEAEGSTAKDASPNAANGTYFGGTTLGQPGGVAGTPDTSVGFDGSTAGVSSSASVSNPSVYSEELWFKTTTTSGGKLIGFGDQPTGLSGNYDRHVYMEDSGRLTFGVWTGQANTITSPDAYNDGKWHHLVAEQGGNGMALYVDAVKVGTNPQTQSQAYTGYWRVGGDTAWGGSSNWFQGSIDEVAVYSSVLSADEISAHQAAGSGAVVNKAPTAAFTSTVAGLAASFDGSGSSDPEGAVTYAWDFGDAGASTVAKPDHTYAAAGTYQVKLTVTDAGGLTDSVTKAVTVAAPVGPQLVASDDFTRALTGGWGTADQGGAYTLTSAKTNFKVANGVGSMTMTSAGAGPTASLAGVSAKSADVQVTVTPAAKATGGGTYMTIFGRVVNGSSYRSTMVFKSDGTVTLGLSRVDAAGVSSTIVGSRTVTGLSYAAGDAVNVRFQTVGTSPTTLRARAWKVGQPEPTTWQVTGADSTAALQAAGSVTLQSYLSGSSTNAPAVLGFDALKVYDTGQ